MSAGPCCPNGHPTVPEIYNANGWERWCFECGALLNGPQPQMKMGRQPTLLVPFLAVLAATVVALMVVGWLFGWGST